MGKTWSLRLVITSCSDIAEIVDSVGSGAGGVTAESKFESHCEQELLRMGPAPLGHGVGLGSSCSPKRWEAFNI